MYWHTPPLYNPRNYTGNPVNIFGPIVSLNMLCLPRKLAQEAHGLEPVRVPAAD
jgi:hypothetical protein